MCVSEYAFHPCGCKSLTVNNIACSTVQDGASPLYVASQDGRTDIVDILLKSRANPNRALMVSTMQG